MPDHPALHVALHPLTVSGSYFRPSEHVTVIANVPPRMVSRRTVASRDGSFVLVFDEVEDTPRGLRVRASGAEGSAAMYALRQAQISPPTN